jgi:hypothetical protein
MVLGIGPARMVSRQGGEDPVGFNVQGWLG